MQHTENKAFPVWYALIILPAISLGVFAMAQNGISSVLWGQQAAWWCAGLLLALFMRRAATLMKPTLLTVLFMLFLLATLFGEAVDGVKRWVDLGIFNVNAAMLILPAMITMLYRIKFPRTALLITAVLLSIQPDLSQLAAFSAAAVGHGVVTIFSGNVRHVDSSLHGRMFDPLYRKRMGK